MIRSFFRASTAARLASAPALPQATARAAPLRLANQLQVHPIRNLGSSPRLFKAGKQEWSSKGPISYEELKPLTERPTDDILLLDVREPAEVIQGNIPSSVNLPMSEFEEALKMDDADFSRKYAFKKPFHDQKMIVHCKSGKRSESVKQALQDRGYSNVRNYTGSYDDWRQKEQAQPSSSEED